jgi:hypothetical protein
VMQKSTPTPNTDVESNWYSNEYWK